MTLFDEMRGSASAAVRLMGGGEPLFRKDAEPLIRGLGERGLRIADVTTNGVLLTEPVCARSTRPDATRSASR